LRVLHLRRRFLAARDTLAPAGSPEASALARVLRELMDEDVPLASPRDRAIDLPPSVMGRPVPGAGLIICYVPAGDEVHIVALVRDDAPADGA
jgi:hypothetical protein